MPVTPTYPGVYLEEISSGVRTITGVATSITAFIGRAQRGPTNKAVTINSFGDFERISGGLWLESSLGFAVRDFYQNGGSQAIIVRLFSPQFADDAAQQAANTAAQTQAETAAVAVIKAATDAAAVVAPAPPATAQSVAAAADAAIAAAGAPGQAALGAAKAVAQAAKDAAAATGATPQSVATAATNAKAVAVTAAANEVAPVTKAQLSAGGLTLESADEGTWGNYLRVRIDTDVSESVAHSLGLQKSDLFNLTVRDTKTGATEQFRNLTIITTSFRNAKNVLENESKLVRVHGSLPATTPTSHSAPTPGKDVFEADATSSPVRVKASDGNALTEANFTGTGKAAKKEGLFALDQADLFNILCIPPYLVTGDIDATLIDSAIDYCEKHRAIFLVDPLAGWDEKEKAKIGIASAVGKVSRNAALFFPRLRQPNPLRNNQVEDFAPCGAIAGIFARTDTQRGVWKAPAGLEATLSGVPQLSVALTDAENGELNPLGINCLRTMPAAGRIVWGARTRVGDDRLASEWKYIPVRRTALFIEESLFRALQWVVFEPNDEPLWSQIRLNVGAFMQNLFRQGAFQGSTPRDAYFVKCDKETTTQTDINLGIVNIVVGFAPLKPAEFVIVKLQQMAGQIQV